jgi:hypothetical protein
LPGKIISIVLFIISSVLLLRDDVKTVFSGTEQIKICLKKLSRFEYSFPLIERAL